MLIILEISKTVYLLPYFDSYYRFQLIFYCGCMRLVMCLYFRDCTKLVDLKKYLKQHMNREDWMFGSKVEYSMIQNH